MNRFEVLDAAKDALERGHDKHGDFENSFVDIARAWSERLNVEVTPAQAALMMVDFKLIRQQQRPNVDNYVDALGYLAMAAELDTP